MINFNILDANYNSILMKFADQFKRDNSVIRLSSPLRDCVTDITHPDVIFIIKPSIGKDIDMCVVDPKTGKYCFAYQTREPTPTGKFHYIDDKYNLFNIVFHEDIAFSPVSSSQLQASADMIGYVNSNNANAFDLIESGIRDSNINIIMHVIFSDGTVYSDEESIAKVKNLFYKVEAAIFYK